MQLSANAIKGDIVCLILALLKAAHPSPGYVLDILEAFNNGIYRGINFMLYVC